MPISSGDRLGPYTIVAPLGAGGMGEVYRARDSRLERDVAIKVLGPTFAADADRVRRFTIEAQATGALNHPNILAVHDLGTHEGAPYLVTELLEGETLRARIDADRIPLSKALELARQVASGLAAAHAKGITHRDIKPENLFVTADGRVKILDFGLAKQAGGAGDASTVLQSPTSVGMVLGTAAYMSPEQVRGEPADPRSDIFSFGVVLYELLAGRRPFTGDTAVQTMNAILTEDPAEIETTGRPLPPALERVVRHCLEKKPDERFQSARDLAFALDALASGSGTSASTVAALTPIRPATTPERRWLPAALVALGMVAGLAIATFGIPADRTEVYHYKRFATEADAEVFPAWSPDGRMIAFTRTVDGRSQIFVQSLDLDTPRQLTRGAEGGSRPFWWPDSQKVGYIGAAFSGIWSVQVVGGNPSRIYDGTFQDATIASNGTMAAWRMTNGRAISATVVVAPSPGAPFEEYTPAPFKMDADHTLISVTFAPDAATLILSTYDAGTKPVLWRLPFPAGSSEPVRVPLTRIPFVFPPKVSWLPDSRHFVVAAPVEGFAEDQLWLLDAEEDDAAQLTSLTETLSFPAVSPAGDRVVFAAGQPNYDLVEIPMDGSPVRNVLATSADEAAGIWVPSTRRFLYVTRRTGLSQIRERDVTRGNDRALVTAEGSAETLFGAVASPDGEYVAYSRLPSVSTWIRPIGGGPARKLTKDGGTELGLGWSPEGTRIAVGRYQGGSIVLRIMSLSGDRSPEDIPVTGALNGHPVWSPDGRAIALPTDNGLALLTPGGTAPQRMLVPGRRVDVVQWSPGSDTVYVPASRDGRFQIDAVDVASGRSRAVATLPPGVIMAVPANPMQRLSWNADATALLTTVVRDSNTDLWILEGLRPPSTGWRRWFGR